MTYAEPQAVVNDLIKYLEIHYPSHRTFHLTYRDATECVKYWAARNFAIPTPAAILEKSSPDLCFHRLNFDFSDPQHETPTFDEFLSRCDHPDAIMAWVGSLFDLQSDRQQYLWIYGAGGDTKSRFANAIFQLLRSTATSTVVPKNGGERFWTSTVVDKRFVLFPDCNNYGFPNSGLFKSLSGGDLVAVEPKGKNAYSVMPICKMMFLSNDKPSISGTAANLRRVIYSEVRPFTGEIVPEHVINKKFADESPSFVIKCLAKYRELGADHGSIKFASEKLTDLVALNEDKFSNFVEKWIRKSEGAGARIRASRLSELAKLADFNQFEYRELLTYLHRTFPEMESQKSNGIRYWKGIRETTSAEYASNFSSDRQISSRLNLVTD